MAKFELNLYDMTTEKVVKTHQRNMVSVALYCKFQDLNDKLTKEQVKSDKELFLNHYKDLFLEMFPEMTEKEYIENTDPAEVMALWYRVCEKALILEGNSKN